MALSFKVLTGLLLLAALGAALRVGRSVVRAGPLAKVLSEGDVLTIIGSEDSIFEAEAMLSGGKI